VKSNGDHKRTAYEEKFADFIKMLAETDAEVVIIHNPQALGDDYDEVIESLNRLADAEKSLKIVPRKERQGSKSL